MKRCPECRKDYFDETLVYCLDDGASLVQGGMSEEPATAIMRGGPVSGNGRTRSLGGTNGDRTSSVTLNLPAFLSGYRLPWIVAGIFALATLSLSWAYLTGLSKVPTEKAMRLSFEPPADLAFNDMMPDWAVISPDGQRIAFSASDQSGKNMLYVRELTSTEARLLSGSDNPLEPFWSPDSRSIAYGSNGKLKRSISRGWSRDGSELFFLAPDGRLMSVGVKTAASDLEFSPPAPLFRTRMLAKAGAVHEFDVSPDGQRFLIGTLIGETKVPPPIVILNWTSLLKN
jgi:hypothetical protein